MASRRPTAEKRVTALQVLATLALTGLVVYGCVLFLVRIQDLVFILIASIFLAYILYPIVHRLARRMHMVLAIGVVYVAIAVLIALVVMYMVPPLIADAATFVKAIPKLVTDISHSINDPHNRLFALLPAPIREYLANLPVQLVHFVQEYGFSALHQAATFLFSAVTILAAIIVVPVLTAYILLDQENLVRVFLGFFPNRTRPKAKAMMLDLDRVLGGFIRGQILDAIAVGVLVFIVLTIFHVPYAYLVAVFSGIFQIIPYLGAIVAFFPAVALAWINNGSGNAIGVGLSVIAVHQIDGNIIAPRIMRDNVGLSPFWIIVSVLGFTELFGFLGTFIAVPAAAMIRVVKMHLLPEAVEPEEAKPTPRDHALRLDDDEIANVEHR